MNKTLPIILVVVLSGCSGNTKTPLENCADAESNYNATDDAISLQPEMMQEILNHFYSEGLVGDSKAEERGEYLKSIKKQDYYDKRVDKYIDDHNSAKNRFYSMPVQKKLKNSRYFYSFVECEKKRDEYPMTFDTKWK